MSNRLKRMGKQLKNNTPEQQAVKPSLTLILLTIVLIGLVIGLSVIPIKYSTVNNKRTIAKLTDTLIKCQEGLMDGEYGIIASDRPVEVEGSDYNVISSADYITSTSAYKTEQFNRLKDLGILKSNVNPKDLWTIYAGYAYDIYNKNMPIFNRISLWYSALQEEDTSGYMHDCDGTECPFVQEVSSVLEETEDAIKNSNAHKAYHKSIESAAAQLELSDDELKQVYEAYVLTSAELVKDITLKFTVLNTQLQESKLFANWAAHGNRLLVNSMLGNISYKKTFTGNEIVELYKLITVTDDVKAISTDVAELVPITLFQLGINGVVSTGGTTITNVSDVENLEEWLEEHDPNKVKTVKQDDVLTTNRLIDIGYGQIYWEIESINHLDNIPTYDECKNNQEWLFSIRKSLTEQSVWQVIYENN